MRSDLSQEVYDLAVLARSAVPDGNDSPGAAVLRLVQSEFGKAVGGVDLNDQTAVQDMADRVSGYAYSVDHGRRLAQLVDLDDGIRAEELMTALCGDGDRSRVTIADLAREALRQIGVRLVHALADEARAERDKKKEEAERDD